MIIVTRPNVTEAELDAIREKIESLGLRTHLSRGERRTIIGCIGDERLLEEAPLLSLPGVESVTPILKPYKLASREFVAGPTVVAVGDERGASIGGRALTVIAGPCSVEGREMLLETASAVRRAGAAILRGGAFKPRTSPYAFQGLGPEALDLLAEVRERTGLPVVTEVMDARQIDLVAEHVDMLQVGARNMQNFTLLAELGRVRRPVLLKRGIAATVPELLLAAEYVMTRGNASVVLCERGIRTFETTTRYTLDVAAIPVLKRETHLPVIVDPSHAAGIAELVPALAYAAIAAGADGLMVEVHPRPGEARSDGDQSLGLEAFDALMRDVAVFARAAGRTVPDASRRRGTTASEDARDDIARLRGELEHVDEALVTHLAERMRLAREIGAAKQADGRLTLDPAREIEVLRRIDARAREHGLPADDVREIYWRIIALCRSAQWVDR